MGLRVRQASPSDGPREESLAMVTRELLAAGAAIDLLLRVPARPIAARDRQQALPARPPSHTLSRHSTSEGLSRGHPYESALHCA
jgi:hypothetical protein